MSIAQNISEDCNATKACNDGIERAPDF